MSARVLASIRRRTHELLELLDLIEAERCAAQEMASWPRRGGEVSKVGSGASDPTAALALDGRAARLRRALDSLDRSLRISSRELGWRIDRLAAAMRDEPSPVRGMMRPASRGDSRDEPADPVPRP